MTSTTTPATPSSRRWGFRRGFSLIEAMVAGSILVIVLTSTAGSLALGFRFIAERRLRTQAEMVVQSHMEMLLAVDRERAIVPFDCQPVTYTRDVIGAGAGTFTASCRLLRDIPRTGFNRLEVTVETLNDGRPIRATYATYVVNK